MNEIEKTPKMETPVEASDPAKELERIKARIEEINKISEPDDAQIAEKQLLETKVSNLEETIEKGLG